MLKRVPLADSQGKFGLRNCNIAEPVVYIPPHILLFHTLVQVTSGLTCVTERIVYVVCACVFIVPKNLAQVRDDCLY